MASQQGPSGVRPLLRTKTCVPVIPVEFVHRPRLTERINRGVKGPLTLLSAPAGFGKTNLLVEWVAQAALPVAWLTLDSEDNDPVRFFRYLSSALQGVEPRLGEEFLDFIQSTKGIAPEEGLTLLINEVSAFSEDMALVLDELHVLETPSIQKSLAFLLKHLPRNLHLLIATRSELALDLAFLRAKRQVVELGVDELRFTSEEVALFFKQTIGHQLSAETVQALEKRTDGWITGLQMAAISLRNQADPVALLGSLRGDSCYLADFLAEEVLYRQPEPVRQFLLQSSILDVLSGSLCEAVVAPDSEPGYGVRMLDWLERANLFVIALDERHEWYRYHHLFADFLRHTQEKTNPSQMPLLHKRAALWFERHGDLGHAFQHALAVEDGGWAADLIERNIQTMIRTGELSTLTRWISRLPREIVRQRSRLSLAYIWGLIAAYQLDEARYWLDDLQQNLDSAEKRQGAAATGGDLGGAPFWNIRGELALCRSLLALTSGDAQQAAEFTREALDHLQEDNPFVLSMLSLEDSLYCVLLGDTSRTIQSLQETARIARQANNLLVMVVAACQLAEAQAMQGRLNQALATLRKAQFMARGPDGEVLPLAGIVDVAQGEILRERDDLDEARVYLERGCRVTQELWSLSSLDGLLSLARLLQARGDIAGSQNLLMEASRMALSTESSQWDDALISAVAVRLALQRHDIATAMQWWKKGGLSDFAGNTVLRKYPYHVLEHLLLIQARLDLTVGQDTGDVHRLQRALERLRFILPEAERLKRVTSKIEILVLQAMAQRALGETDQAARTLLQALAIGEPEGYRRIYLDEGWPIVELLPHCRSVLRDLGDYLPTLSYIESLLEAARREQGKVAPAAPRRDAADRAPSSVAEERSGLLPTKVEEGYPVLLSFREAEVLTLIAEGKSNQEIAAQLCLALNTVKRHAYNIYAKLDVEKRTQAVSKARRLGLIP